MPSLIKRALLIILVITATILSGSPVAVLAQTGSTPTESISLSPAVNKPIADAGTVVKSKMTVINDGALDYRFVVYARPFSVTNENYDPNFTEVNQRTEAYNWVQFDNIDVTLKAGDRIDIPYSITVPKDAAPGGHYAVLFAETQPALGDGTQVVRKKRVGSLLYITVNGDTKEEGTVLGWSFDGWQKKKPIVTSIRIKNGGNTHFLTSTHIVYSNIFGKEILVHNQEHLVMPGTTRRITSDFNSKAPVGIYKVSGTINYLGETTDLNSRFIVLLPYTVLAGIIAVVILLIVVLIVRKRKKSGGGKKSKSDNSRAKK